MTLELEGNSVLIESFVLKEEVIKKLKQFKSKVREIHYVFVLTTEPLYVTVIKCEKKNISTYKKRRKRVMFDTIHHIAIIGSDYEQSKHFYVDLLGFKIIRENYRKERDDYKIDMACGLQEIELFIIKNAPARVNYPEALGLRHLAFKVESVDDTVKELNGKGIETEPVRLDDYTGKKMTFFHDPDGLPLEIHE